METEFAHRDLTERIIGLFYEVYNQLGHGFLESVSNERKKPRNQDFVEYSDKANCG